MEKITRFVPESDPEFQRRTTAERQYVKGRFWAAHNISSFQWSSDLLTASTAEDEDLQQFQSDIAIHTPSETSRRALWNIHPRRDELRVVMEDAKRSIEERIPGNIKLHLNDLFADVIALQKQAERTAEPEDWLTKRISFLTKEISHMLEAPATARYLGEQTGESHSMSTPQDTEKLLSVLVSEHVPAKALYEMLSRHNDRMIARELQFREFYNAQKKEFVTAAEAAISKGLIPAEVRKLLSRLDEVPLAVIDRFMAAQSLTQAHAIHSREVAMYSDELENIPAARHHLFHEFLHVLEGRTVHASSERGGTEYEFEKGGVSLRSNEFMVKRFDWLNEAITEWLALQLSGAREALPENMHAYGDERASLNDLFSKGLDSHLAVSAYFENVTSDQPMKDRARHFSALVARINEIGVEAYKEPYLFNKLENKSFYNKVIDPNIERMGFIPSYAVSGTDELRERMQAPCKVYRISCSLGGNEKSAYKTDYYAALDVENMAKNEKTDEDVVEIIKDRMTGAFKKIGRRFTFRVEALG